ncbi:MAG: RNA polymerase sigma factor [Planctomycetota bacterium]
MESTPFAWGETPKVGDEPQSGDTVLIAALRRRDEQAFETLLSTYGNALARTARRFVRSDAIADEVVQETWLGVLKGIDRFEGRSSLKTWIFTILMNTARTRGQREARNLTFSSLVLGEMSETEPLIDSARFQGSSGEYPDHWEQPPSRWEEDPGDSILNEEMRAVVRTAMDELPPAQREVMSLRDLEDLSSEDVCQLLGISDSNFRVLLHRARSKVRARLERYFAGEVKR